MLGTGAGDGNRTHLSALPNQLLGVRSDLIAADVRILTALGATGGTVRQLTPGTRIDPQQSIVSRMLNVRFRVPPVSSFKMAFPKMDEADE